MKFQILPHYMSLTPPAYDNLNLQAGQYMVTAGLEIKKQKMQEILQNPQKDDVEREKAIEEHFAYLELNGFNFNTFGYFNNQLIKNLLCASQFH